jgi:radical SAM protein with 4Fe4S-binding SPASM domain
MEHTVIPAPRQLPARKVRDSDLSDCVPVLCVWELTLACNLKCTHCGSRAGAKRQNEMSLDEATEVIEALARLGTREIAIIGGETFLRKDWIEIVRRISANGMVCTMQTGGYKLPERFLAAAQEAGLKGLGVSIDGLPETHDRLRGMPDSYAEAMKVLDWCGRNGLSSSVNTQITRMVIPELQALARDIAGHGARYWQVQLTVAMGNAVDNDRLLLQPYDLLEIMPVLADITEWGRSHDFILVPGNNLGYFGPFEVLWRGPDRTNEHYSGCAAGQAALGIEADGTIKSCPSLPKERYGGGNVRDLSLSDIWHHSRAMQMNRTRDTSHLWGRCATCYYASVCRGGCTWTADALFGRSGNNPFCHYRALQLAKEGKRERIRKVKDAPDIPFATGLFELIEEDMPLGTVA